MIRELERALHLLLNGFVPAETLLRILTILLKECARPLPQTDLKSDMSASAPSQSQKSFGVSTLTVDEDSLGRLCACPYEFDTQTAQCAYVHTLT